MISMVSEKALSLRDFLDRASSRLGIKQFAGGIGLREPLSRLCVMRFKSLADLSFAFQDTICIVPRCAFPFRKGVPPPPLLVSNCCSRVNPSISACIALAGTKKIPEALIDRLRNSETLLFTSSYNEYLLESRLIGVLKEKTEGQTTLSGGLVNLDGMGIMITGESGLGKTSCALELVKRGHRWVADDVAVVEKKSDGLLYGRSWKFECPLLEIKGWGIVRAEEVMMPSSIMRETRIDFFVELVEEEKRGKGGEPGNSLKNLNILGAHLPCMVIPASRGASNMATKVEDCLRTLRRLRKLG